MSERREWNSKCDNYANTVSFSFISLKCCSLIRKAHRNRREWHINWEKFVLLIKNIKLFATHYWRIKRDAQELPLQPKERDFWIAKLQCKERIPWTNIFSFASHSVIFWLIWLCTLLEGNFRLITKWLYLPPIQISIELSTLGVHDDIITFTTRSGCFRLYMRRIGKGPWWLPWKHSNFSFLCFSFFGLLSAAAVVIAATEAKKYKKKYVHLPARKIHSAQKSYNIKSLQALWPLQSECACDGVVHRIPKCIHARTAFYVENATHWIP